MRLAHVDGERREAKPGLAGTCPGCEGVVVAHCGSEKIWHWKHKSRRRCDPWWENETQWHRDWKNQFPEDWQETVHFDDNGEKHIADVKTERGWVLEFQHSRLEPEERQSRNAFYCPKLIWVVDALRRKTDLTQFEEMMSRASWVGGPGSFRTAPPHNCRLVREWSGSDAQILFDFGPNRALFWMVGQLSNGKVLFANYTHTGFIADVQKDTSLDAHVKSLGTIVEMCEESIRLALRGRSRYPLRVPTRRTNRGWRL